MIFLKPILTHFHIFRHMAFPYGRAIWQCHMAAAIVRAWERKLFQESWPLKNDIEFSGFHGEKHINRPESYIYIYICIYIYMYICFILALAKGWPSERAYSSSGSAVIGTCIAKACYKNIYMATYITIYGHIWTYIWPYMAIYGHIWPPHGCGNDHIHGYNHGNGHVHANAMAIARSWPQSWPWTWPRSLPSMSQAIHGHDHSNHLAGRNSLHYHFLY